MSDWMYIAGWTLVHFVWQGIVVALALVSGASLWLLPLVSLLIAAALTPLLFDAHVALADGAADVCFSSNVLEHVADPHRLDVLPGQDAARAVRQFEQVLPAAALAAL